jgi:tetratricopeptide (TPR) repeat protein
LPHDHCMRFYSFLQRKKAIISSLVLILLLLIGLGIATRRTLFALYHQRQGGILLDYLIRSESGDHESISTCLSDPITEADSQERLETAIAHLEAAAWYKPELSHTYLLLGKSYCLSGETDQAIMNYKDYVEQRPENQLGYVELAIAYEKKWYESEEYSFLPISELNPGTLNYPPQASQKKIIGAWQDADITVQNIIAVGEQLLGSELYDQALIWSFRAMILSPNALQPWLLVGEVYQAEERWDEAISIYKHLNQKFPNNRQVLYELGLVYEMIGEWALALENYQRGLLADTGRVGLSNLYYRIGYILHTKISPPDMDAAWNAYQSALEEDDFPIDLWQKASTYYQMGMILAQQGKWGEAIREYQKAIGLRSNYYEAIVELSRSFWKIGEYDRALSTAMTAMEINPERKYAYYLLSDIYVFLGDNHRAIEMLSMVLELDPNDLQAIQRLEIVNGINSVP